MRRYVRPGEALSDDPFLDRIILELYAPDEVGQPSILTPHPKDFGNGNDFRDALYAHVYKNGEMYLDLGPCSRDLFCGTDGYCYTYVLWIYYSWHGTKEPGVRPVTWTWGGKQN